VGAGPVALALTVLVAAVIAYLAITRVDVQPEPVGEHHGPASPTVVGPSLPEGVAIL